jgi:Peptidase family M41
MPDQRRPRVRRLEQTAYHEAGHAVAAFFHDVPIRHVTIVPGSDYLGRTTYMPRVVSALRRVLDDRGSLRDRELVEHKLLSSACGRAAARRLTGRTSYTGAAGDFENEDEIMFGLGYEGGEIGLYGRLLDSQARRFVDLRWRQVVAVAEALLERQRLDDDELAQIIRTSIDAEMAEMAGGS